MACENKKTYKNGCIIREGIFANDIIIRELIIANDIISARQQLIKRYPNPKIITMLCEKNFCFDHKTEDEIKKRKMWVWFVPDVVALRGDTKQIQSDYLTKLEKMKSCKNI